MTTAVLPAKSVSFNTSSPVELQPNLRDMLLIDSARHCYATAMSMVICTDTIAYSSAMKAMEQNVTLSNWQSVRPALMEALRRSTVVYLIQRHQNPQVCSEARWRATSPASAHLSPSALFCQKERSLRSERV